MALFSAMTLVGIMEGQVPFSHLINAMLGTHVHHFGWHLPAVLGILLTMVVMVGLAWLVQVVIFRHLVNQEPIILFMATIGLAYFMEGFGDLMWGAEIKKLDVGLPQGINCGLMKPPLTSLITASLSTTWISSPQSLRPYWLAFWWFSQYTKQGRAMRAVADDHQAALSVGVSLSFIWVMVWSVAGFVALVAGIMWGTSRVFNSRFL